MPFNFSKPWWQRRAPALIAVWMGLFGLALTCAAGIALALVQYNRSVRDVQNAAEVEGYLLADHAARLFEGATVVLQTAGALSASTDWPSIERSEGLHRQLKAIRGAVPYIADVWINDDSGRLRATSYGFPAPPSDASDRENFQSARRSTDESLFVGPPIVGRITGEPTFLLSRRLSLEDGTFRGMVSVTARLDYFSNYWRGRNLPRRAHVELYRREADGSRSILASFQNVAFPADGQGSPAKSAETDAVGGWFETVRQVGSLPVFLEIQVPDQAAYDAWRVWAWSYLPLVGIAFLGLGALTTLAWRQAGVDDSARAALLAANEELSAEIKSRTEAEQQIRQMQKMQAIGQLTGGIAHDFNNFLTIIIGNSEKLLSESFDRPALFRAAQMIISAAERGAELSHRLLAFARKQPLDPHVVDLDVVLLGIEKLIKQSVGEAIDLKIVRDGGARMALVDPVQFETAVINLAVNAKDAMPGGGHLTIETSTVVLDDQAAAAQDLAAGTFVTVSVSDTGVGMDESAAARAFEPFYTTKPFGKGSGLGLSMVYGFAKQSGGTVKIYSELDIGTTVRIYLPSAQGAAAVPQTAKPAMPLGGSERILIVEDDEEVQSLAAEVLGEGGYTVEAMAHPADALRRLAAQPFDLLFTDVILPRGIGGAELARRARELQPNIKVLFTSGYSENAIVHGGRLDRGVHLLIKPYRRLDLALKIREVLDAD